MQLTQEFYCSLALKEMNKQALDFRMLGINYQFNPNFMKDVFGFAKDGVRKMLSDFHAGHFWAFLIDLPSYFGKGKCNKWSNSYTTNGAIQY